MQHNKVSPLAMFSQPLQYLVPIFQRGYVWTIERQIRPLWWDIADRADELLRYDQLCADAQKASAKHLVREPRKHFLGTVIVTDHKAGGHGEVTTSEVIDGQQRITTTQLLVLALRDALASVNDEFIRHSVDVYAWNSPPYRHAHHHFKVWPTNAGRAEMERIVMAKSLEAVADAFPNKPPGKSKSRKRVPRPLMVEAYMFFYGAVCSYLRGEDFEAVVPREFTQGPISEGMDHDQAVADRWIHDIRNADGTPALSCRDQPILSERSSCLLRALSDYLQLIELRLGPEDDAQIIFETLNDRGERLTPADLVRNFVFLQAARSNHPVDALYGEYWKDFDELPADEREGKNKKFWRLEERQGRLTNTRLDTLLFHYVSLQTREDLKLDHVFEEFKEWWQQTNRDIGFELGRLRGAAEIYKLMLRRDRHTPFGRFAHNVRVLDMSTVIPLVLFLAEKLGVEGDDFLRSIQTLESYVVRRAVCRLTAKAYNRVFAGAVARLQDQGISSANLATYLADLGGETQRWPDDEEFRQAWMTLDMYRTLRAGKTKMILEALELGLRDIKFHESTQLPDVETHVEHVMPQAWQEHYPIAADDITVQLARQHLVHNVGNLTLLTEHLNPSLGNQSFAVKRPQIVKSLLVLNRYFGKPEFGEQAGQWTEAAIRERAKTLYATATTVWPKR